MIIVYSVSSVVLVTLLIAIVLKLYFKLTTGWDTSYKCLAGKTAIVTGSNTGIGYETAKEFAKRGARVILACRNEERAKAAQKKIIQETENANVIVKLVDFSSLDSVRDFAKDINTTEERLDILVNNAGAGLLEECVTKDGLELTMQINYFSSFLLTLLLVDLLKKSAPSRIVNVSSVMAKYAKLNPKDMNRQAEIYARSKLCMILFTKELARRLKGTGVTTFSLHPGAVATDIFRNVNNPVAKVALLIGRYLILKTTLEGAQTQIYLSLAKGVEQFNGKHFHDCHVVSTYKTARDASLAKEVWENSEELVKLSQEERKLYGNSRID